MTAEYKIGDKFRVISDESVVCNLGDILTLTQYQDSALSTFSGSSVPGFEEDCCVFFYRLEKLEVEQLTACVVNAPSHYTQGDIDCIDAIKAALSPEEYRGFLRGNMMKYNWRLGLKGKAVIDSEKCKWYNDKLIQSLKEKE